MQHNTRSVRDVGYDCRYMGLSGESGESQLALVEIYSAQRELMMMMAEECLGPLAQCGERLQAGSPSHVDPAFASRIWCNVKKQHIRDVLCMLFPLLSVLHVHTCVMAHPRASAVCLLLCYFAFN